MSASKCAVVLDKAEARRLSRRAARSRRWWDAHRGSGNSANGADIPPWYISNADLGRLEAHRFMTHPPAALFAYYAPTTAEHPAGITTWTGVCLGAITWKRHYCAAIYGRQRQLRVAISVAGHNGLTYTGTYYCASGDYCRLRVIKRQRARAFVLVNGRHRRADRVTP